MTTKSEARHKAFVEAWITKGSAVEAARAAGYTGSNRTLAVTGQRLLKIPEIAAEIAERARVVAASAELNTANWSKEIAALSFFRVGDLYDKEGALIPIHDLPDRIQAAIAGVEIRRGTTRSRKAGGADGVAQATTTKIKFADKTAALSLMAKHLGLFERDNAQRAENVRVVIELVG